MDHPAPTLRLVTGSSTRCSTASSVPSSRVNLWYLVGRVVQEQEVENELARYKHPTELRIMFIAQNGPILDIN